MAQSALLKQFKELSTNPVPGFTINLKDDDVFTWEVGIIGPPETIYESGYFLAILKFSPDHPFQPPTFAFSNPFFHPNVYPDGRICISILHPPGDDPMSGEKASERWNPTQTVESILLSIISLLNDPNVSSPANVDAAVMFRNDHEKYKAVVGEQVEKSKKDIPLNLVIPMSSEQYVGKSKTDLADKTPDDFWYDDDEEEDFDFSGSEGDNGDEELD